MAAARLRCARHQFSVAKWRQDAAAQACSSMLGVNGELDAAQNQAYAYNKIPIFLRIA
jgi:hypothetical protein